MKRTILLLIGLFSLINIIAQESEKDNKKSSLGFNMYTLFLEDKYDNSLPTFIFIYPLKSFDIRVGADFFYNHAEMDGVNEEIMIDEQYSGENYFGEDKYVFNKYNTGLSIGIQKKVALTDNVIFKYGSDAGYRLHFQIEKMYNWANEDVINIKKTRHSIELKPLMGLSYSPLKKLTFSLESFYIIQLTFRSEHSSDFHVFDFLPETAGTEFQITNLPVTALFVILNF